MKAITTNPISTSGLCDVNLGLVLYSALALGLHLAVNCS